MCPSTPVIQEKSGDIVNNCYVLQEQVGKNDLFREWRARAMYSPNDFLLNFLALSCDAVPEQVVSEFNRTFSALYRFPITFIHAPFEYDEHKGIRYLASSWIDGYTLADAIKGNFTVDYDGVISMAVQVLKGLAELERAGIRHNSLSASVVLHSVDEFGAGAVRLCYFGTSILRDTLVQGASSIRVGDTVRARTERTQLQGPEHDLFAAGLLIDGLLEYVAPRAHTRTGFDEVRQLALSLHRRTHSFQSVAAALQTLLSIHPEKRISDLIEEHIAAVAKRGRAPVIVDTRVATPTAPVEQERTESAVDSGQEAVAEAAPLEEEPLTVTAAHRLRVFGRTYHVIKRFLRRYISPRRRRMWRAFRAPGPIRPTNTGPAAEASAGWVLTRAEIEHSPQNSDGVDGNRGHEAPGPSSRLSVRQIIEALKAHFEGISRSERDRLVLRGRAGDTGEFPFPMNRSDTPGKARRFNLKGNDRTGISAFINRWIARVGGPTALGRYLIRRGAGETPKARIRRQAGQEYGQGASAYLSGERWGPDNEAGSPDDVDFHEAKRSIVREGGERRSDGQGAVPGARDEGKRAARDSVLEETCIDTKVPEAGRFPSKMSGTDREVLEELPAADESGEEHVDRRTAGAVANEIGPDTESPSPVERAAVGRKRTRGLLRLLYLIFRRIVRRIFTR